MDRDTERYKVFSRRAFILGLAKIGLLGVLGTRLAYLQFSQSDRYKTLSERNRINVSLLAPARGKIYDRFGKVVADNDQNFRVNIVAEQSDDIPKTLLELSKIIPLDENEINRVMAEIKKVRAFIPVTIKEQLTWDDVSKIEVNLHNLPGVLIEEGEIRRYPLGEAAAHLLGYVGLVNQAERKDGDSVLTVPGFRIGKMGIEKQLDERLRGKAGNIKVEVNALGRVVRELERDYGTTGESITLSIDADYQSFVQARLAKEKSASAVVMDVVTGSVYALASSPGFDPNLFSTRIPADKWEELLADPAVPLTNKAIAGQYPPGSTFKMITALAALESGAITATTKHFCPGHLDLGNHRFHCWKKGGHGSVNLRDALAESCDVYFYEVSKDVGIQRISDMAQKFGLGQKPTLEMPNVKPGLIPTKEWKMATFGKNWTVGETILASIGQGYLQATPLQLAAMTARLVNGGYNVSPSLIMDVGGKPIETSPKDRWTKISVKEKYLAMVVDGMSAVINSPKGTARAQQIAEPEFRFGGKTGTAQVRRIQTQERAMGYKNQDHLPWHLRHHALFVGYAPIDNPRYACAVVVDHGESGSGSAAPIAKEILYEAQIKKIAFREVIDESKVKTAPVAAPQAVETKIEEEL